MTSTAQALPGARIVGALDQLDLVAVRVGDKGDHGAAALDRAGLARHVAAGGLDLVARGVRVGHADGDVAVGAAHVVAFHAPVVGEFDLGLAGVAAVKAEEGQRVLVFWVFAGAQQLHAQNVSVEIDGTLQVANAQHGVK